MQGFLSSFFPVLVDKRFLSVLRKDSSLSSVSFIEIRVHSVSSFFSFFFSRIMDFSSRKIEKIRRPLPFVFLVEIKVYSSGIRVGSGLG